MAILGRIGSPDTGGIRELQRNLLEISKIQQRLSSGRRLTSAADDPSALVLSERLRSQLAGTAQAIENTERAAGLVRTAEGALSETSLLLVRAKELSLASDDSLSEEELDANQSELDSILRSIDRVAGTTDFAGKALLNGAADFVQQQVDPAFRRIEVNRAQLGPAGETFAVEVTASATRAAAGGAIAAAQPGDATFEITGLLGTAVVSVADGATRAEIAEAINQQRESTGVEADATTGAIRSVEYGSDAFVEVGNVAGTLSGVTQGRTAGTDVAATVGGEAASARGNRIFFNTGAIGGEAILQDGTAPGTYSFTIAGGGLDVQAGEGINPNERLRFGIRGTRSSDLGAGESAGGLTTLARGGPNDLRTDPARASQVIDAAIADVARARGGLGAVERNALDTNVRSLSIARENLAAAESRLADTDIGQAVAEFIAARIRSQAQIAVLGLRGAQAGGVLDLLG